MSGRAGEQQREQSPQPGEELGRTTLFAHLGPQLNEGHLHVAPPQLQQVQAHHQGRRAAQQPVELEVSFKGMAAGVRQPVACIAVACEFSDVTYEYILNAAGETLSGASSCLEPTCSSGARTHELSTTDTNKFFANLQGVNLISPLVLGGAYAQMLQGAAAGKGHKINF